MAILFRQYFTKLVKDMRNSIMKELNSGPWKSSKNIEDIINSTNLIDAFEKIVIGLPKISKENNWDEEELVAYHEAGHTLNALLFKEFFDVRKVTINANTNGAGGYTLFTPKEKYNSYPTKKYLLDNFKYCFVSHLKEYPATLKLNSINDKLTIKDGHRKISIKTIKVKHGNS